MKIALTSRGKPRINKMSARPRALKTRYSVPSISGLQSHMMWMTVQDPLGALRKRESILGNKGRTPGHIHGVTLKTAMRYRIDAQRDARKIVRYMKEKKIFEADNNLAEEALEAAVSVVRDKAVPIKDKLAASKLVLEYTQTKPATKTDVQVHQAEAFLQGVLDDVDAEKANGDA